MRGDEPYCDIYSISVPHMRGDEPDRADYVHGYVPNAVLPDVWEDLKLLKKK
jgi:hypothetical protein